MAVPSIWAGGALRDRSIGGTGKWLCFGGVEHRGLPEAVEPCGLLFPICDANAMVAALKRLLLNSRLRETLLAARESHLAQFQTEKVARRYMDIFESVLRKSAGAEGLCGLAT
jgi:hypothetical protein